MSRYDLDSTLDSGQVFRWTQRGSVWEGVVATHWVQLRPTQDGLIASTTDDPGHWAWLTSYLQTEVDLDSVLRQLPKHPFLRKALRAHRGLRLIRQDPWECLASFILSSTKQIAQIKQIVERLSRLCGTPIKTPQGANPAYAFPSPDEIARMGETDLRALGMGFRAPYLLEAAKRVAEGRCPLADLQGRPIESARAALMDLPGVGRKVADCVLLFSLGFNEAFPVDVWVMNTLQAHWFPGQQMNLRQLVRFAETHFGAYGGYAQQYLFHFARMHPGVNGKTHAE